MKSTVGIIALLLFTIWTTSVNAGTPPVSPEGDLRIESNELLSSLAPHPRIILTPERFEQLRSKIADTPWATELAGELHKLADELVAGKKLEGWRPKQWELAGTGSVSRISCLALAYKLYGDEKYLREADRSLRLIAKEIQMEDVGVEYLKRAAVLTALAIGYDWLHDALSPETLELIEQGILYGGAVDLIRNEKYKIPGNNWTTVSYGGTAIAMLAIAERQPELAAKSIEKAAQLLPTITAQYQPDGISFEGPHYWDFPTAYHAILTDALQTALHDDFGLATAPGLRESFDWRLAARGPSGDDFYYGDGERANRAVTGFAWAAKQYRLDYLVTRADLQRMMQTPERYREKTWMVFPLIWCPADAVDQSPPEELLVFQGEGPSANVIFRSAWNDPDALWLAIKGGRANVSHGHMDVGSFQVEAGGVRWLEELETHHYYSTPFRDAGITDIWNYDDLASDRWKVYAWNNQGHNTLTIDKELHDPNAMGNIAPLDNSAEERTATIDLSDTLGEKVDTAKRTFQVLDDNTVLIADCWTASDGAFTMKARLHTLAEVKRDESKQVTRAKDGKQLALQLIEPDDAEIVIAPASDYMQPWDRHLDGMTAIDIRLKTLPGQTRTLVWKLSLQ